MKPSRCRLLSKIVAACGSQSPWLFDTDSARRQLNEQFGTHDLGRLRL